MTRNEFIAETAARFAAADPSITDDVCITQATGLAHSLEARNVAPWLTPPAPALTDAARRVVEAAVAAYADDVFDLALARQLRHNLRNAVRAYKESDK